eukprot:GILK01003347.1.p1 GENE.GILK01003347.1~~GILK01003347.1.p1  ORF type:complete len:440 (-),score=74.92 GILK01003347.1:215-1534(-)
MSDFFARLSLNEESFVSLLSKLIGETEILQNNPPLLIPQEDRPVQHVLDALAPYLVENGGVLTTERISYAANRSNLIIRYPAATATTKCITFAGSHLDVVPADPKNWTVAPFQLTVEGDLLYGRGTTDCLGHVALITELFMELAKSRPALNMNVVAVFIASEESGAIPNLGAEALLRDGKFDGLENGPLLWIDCADMQPCIGTGGMLVWELKATGKLAHSGFPHKGINAIELATDAVNYLQSRFHADFPRRPEEETYKFAIPSTMKPTQVKFPEGGSINQIPADCIICGDIRFTPFYRAKDIMAKVNGYLEDLNKDLSVLPSHGPVSKYILPNEFGGNKGQLSIEWEADPSEGIACRLDSLGHRALVQATQNAIGNVSLYSMTGSVPCVRDLQDKGFDVQLVGYGVSEKYHFDDEYCRLSDMKTAMKILAEVLSTVNGQ